jgi:hypothetical protein
MSDFLASLVARNLGDGAGAPEGRDDAVLPRTPAAFEPDGAGVAAELMHDAVPEAAAVAPVPEKALADTPPPRISTPEPAPEPAEPAEVRARRPAGQAADPSTPRQRTLMVGTLPVPSEPPIRPNLANTSRTAERQTAVSMPPAPSAADSWSAGSPLAPPAREGAEKSPARPLLPEVRIERREVGSDESLHARAAAPRQEPDPGPPAPHRRQGDPMLERIVRQMVLSPRPDPAPPPAGLAPAPSHAERLELSAPPPSITPKLAAPDSRFAEAHKATPEAHEVARLSPVPVPPRLPDRPAETTVRINIGRIEVRTGTEPPAEAAPRPKRPEAKLMSLDDYLAERAKEG